VLAKANRVTRGADYKTTVRRGARFTGAHAVVYARRRPEGAGGRFGFIVGKTVGIATRRNRVRRRLKAICWQLLPTVAPGTDVVIRALPGSATTDWATLQEEIVNAVDKVGTR
jgi:ribonuclease P protein component